MEISGTSLTHNTMITATQSNRSDMRIYGSDMPKWWFSAIWAASHPTTCNPTPRMGYNMPEIDHSVRISLLCGKRSSENPGSSDGAPILAEHHTSENTYNIHPSRRRNGTIIQHRSKTIHSNEVKSREPSDNIYKRKDAQYEWLVMITRGPTAELLMCYR